MKEYTRDYQIEMNIDWFFLGKNGTIAQFSSAGGILPDIIASNAEDNIILNNYIDSIEPFTEIILNPFLDKYFNIANVSSISDYSHYATKGILPFDKTYACPGDFDITYHLIAKPMKTLNFDNLPDAIKDIVLRMRQNIIFEDFYKLDAGYSPWASLFTDYYVETLYKSSNKKNNI